MKQGLLTRSGGTAAERERHDVQGGHHAPRNPTFRNLGLELAFFQPRRNHSLIWRLAKFPGSDLAEASEPFLLGQHADAFHYVHLLSDARFFAADDIEFDSIAESSATTSAGELVVYRLGQDNPVTRDCRCVGPRRLRHS